MPKLKIDNPFFRFMGKLGDLVILSVLWLLCCLPVVTIGASTTALFYVARKIAAEEDYQTAKDFFRAFRRNWKQATQVWLLLLASGALFLADLLIGLQTEGAQGNLFRGIGGVLCILWLLVCGYVFPLLARYEYKTGQLLRMAALMSIRRPLTSVMILLLTLWLPLLLWYDLNAGLYLLPLWLLVGGGASALSISNSLLPFFSKLEHTGKEASETSEEADLSDEMEE